MLVTTAITKRRLLLSLLVVVLSLAYLPFAQWAAMSPAGTRFFMDLGFLMPVVLMCMFVVVSIKMLLNKNRKGSLSSLLILVAIFPAFSAGVRIGNRVRMSMVELLPARAKVLVDTISQYEKDRQKPPESLADLVPEYLTGIPNTGMGAYPAYEYHTGEESVKEYNGNPWALSIFTPNVGINFDRLLYFPMQNYPEHGYGGTLQRIGDWAYVHE